MEAERARRRLLRVADPVKGVGRLGQDDHVDVGHVEAGVGQGEDGALLVETDEVEVVTLGLELRHPDPDDRRRLRAHRAPARRMVTNWPWPAYPYEEWATATGAPARTARAAWATRSNPAA